MLILISGKQTYRDLGIGVDKSSSKRISVKIMYQHDISIYKASHNTGDLVVKDPHATGFEKSSFSFFQCNHCKTHIISPFGYIFPIN